MDLETTIRRLASQGKPKAEVARILEIPENKFRMVCSLLPDITWKRYTASGVGKRSDSVVVKLQANLDKAKRARREKYLRTLYGVTGTVQELCAHFKPPVSDSTVNRRLAAGMSLERAMFAVPEGKGRKSSWMPYNSVNPALLQPCLEHVGGAQP